MTAKLIQIGNSQGVRLPKALIKEAGLAGEVTLRLQGKKIIIEPKKKAKKKKNPRAGWEEQIRKALEEHGDDIEEWREWQAVPNDFDEKEWAW